MFGLGRAIAEDTVRNEYVFRARIHEWPAVGAAVSDVAKLNDKVYAELFLTPEVWGILQGGAYQPHQSPRMMIQHSRAGGGRNQHVYSSASEQVNDHQRT